MPYETFAASDGSFVVAVGNDSLLRAFCRACGLEALGEDPRYSTNPQRVDAYDEIVPVIAGRLRTRTRAEWIEALNAAGVPCGAVRDVGEVLQDPQIASRQMIERVEHATLGSVPVLGLPAKLSDTPGSVRSAPPVLGQHTESILRNDLGFSAADIVAMRSAGAI